MNARSFDSKMDFEVTNEVGNDEWQEIADRCSYATFFHTPSWFVAFSKTYPRCEIVTKRFLFADGTVALLPLMEQRTFGNFARNYLIGPAGCYGGWISASDLGLEHITAISDWIFRTLPSFTWRLNPLDERTSLIERNATVVDTTEMLSLRDFQDEAQLRQNYKRSVRKEINKAARAGLMVKVAKNWNEWEQFFGLYQMALNRWGDKATSKYQIDLFKNLFRLRSDKIKLWLVMRQDDIIGGNLNFYHNKHCVEWHAAFDSQFFGIGVRNYLVDQVISDALHRGYVTYDFNPSGPHEGTRRFKQAFGTSQVAADLIVLDKTPYSLRAVRKLLRLFR